MVKKFFKFIKRIIRGVIHFFPWYARLYKGRAWYTKATVGIVSFFVAIFLYLGMVDINFLWLFGKSPGFVEIKTPPTYAASEIYSADSVLIGRFYKENRTPVKYEEVTPAFWKALISTEDERFYSHHGIDFMGIGGAIKDALTRGDGRGASTITQQLAKNMFRVRTQYSAGLLGHVPGLRMLIMKSKEWIIAVKLELIYSKKEILTMYANTVDFGNNSYGVKTAAKTYFNTTPAKMSVDQAATLVGMLKATTYYNPITHAKNSIRRRNTVLYNMVTHNVLPRDEYDEYSRQPLKLDIHVEENYDGQAQYFREYVADYLKDWMKDNGYDLYSSGLRIYTTIDTRMQKYAEQAVSKQMEKVQQQFDNHWRGMQPWRDAKGDEIPGFIEGIAERQPFYKKLVQKYPNQPDSVLYYLNKPHKVKLFDYAKGQIEKEMSSMDSIRYMVKFMHCAMVAMEPQSGAVRAWVGDIDFKTWKYDKVVAERQPGSTFKLFVYSEAFNQGLTPCDKRRDEYISMQVLDKKTGQMKTWTPHNANGRFSNDSLTLKSAFGRSINSVAVRLGQEMGIKNIIRTAQDMGIKSPLDDEPSLALGSSDVNLLEMVDAYSTVANDGEHHDPVVVTRILDKDGNEVYVAPKDHSKALPYRTAFLMQEMLKGGVNEAGGTSQALRHYIFNDTDWGGKTGTSNNHSDAWFMAVSPNLVVGAWVGGEYRSIHFRTGALGQGSKTALPVCGEFIYSLMRDKAFQKYHAKWQLDPDEDIDPSMYSCQPVAVRRQLPDSLRGSSTARHSHQEQGEETPEEEGEGNEEGGFELEPAPQPAPERHSSSNSNETQQIIKKAKRPHSEDMEI
ncbi:transglycosylase domain-containing protein [Prevotella denticola]|uniref:transglycosylase domain-containing protein n=1 Tax=Prevotella denticola TaxID=28129 RepID=UPI00050E894E|nr:transglycosylase domain-containing protein [Prevotella denticola]KGF41748.1 transglycosylase [Prevotella denticola DNF00960]